MTPLAEQIEALRNMQLPKQITPTLDSLITLLEPMPKRPPAWDADEFVRRVVCE
jgi:hypothetical protein